VRGRPAGRVRIQPGPSQLSPGLLGQLDRGQGQQLGQRRRRVAVARSESQRVDHLPGAAQRCRHGRVAELAGLGLVRLGGGVQLGVGGAARAAAAAPSLRPAGGSSVVELSTRPGQ
jgi:hypothetical protein